MYYRYSNSENPMSDWGHAMFVDNEDSSSTYGCYLFLYNGSESVNIEDLKDVITNAWNKSADNFTLPFGYENIDAEDIFNAFNPEDIVMSADGWDNGDLLTWFCEFVAIANDIKAIITNDGAIVFDSELIKRAKNNEKV